MFTLPDELPDFKETISVCYYLHVNRTDNNNSKLHFTKSCISIGINGMKRLQTTNGIEVFHPGDLIYYTPGNYLSYQNIDTDQPYKSLMIFFDAMEFSNLLRQFEETTTSTCDLPPDVYYLSLKQDPHIPMFANFIIQSMQMEGLFSTPLQKIKLLELIVYLKQIFGDFLTSGIHPFRQLSEIQLRKVIDGNTNNNLTLEEIAFMCNMSLATFKRSFAKIYGTTPGRWIREKKLAWAEEQIRKFHRQPKEVYQEAGYQDYSSFSYAFKQKFGVSPRNTS